jgi:ferredoxin-type protein NapG
MHLAKGLLGRHYRLGWEEKQKKGGALVTPDLPHEYNLPEGMRYEHGGRGLIREAPPAGLPDAGGVPSEPVLEAIPRKGGGI